MLYRTLGRTGLQVSLLGFGGSQLGHAPMDDAAIDRLIGGTLDLGVSLFDTAHCYHQSEARIGRALGGRRDQCVLVTKCGHNFRLGDDVSKWTPRAIELAVERSLTNLRTDRLDVLLLHSCEAEVLARGDVVEAALRCREQGKTRVVGFAGDSDRAQAALAIDAFDCIECSLNLCDQQSLQAVLPAARERNLGVLVKRPLANAPWRDDLPAHLHKYGLKYRNRLATMGLNQEAVGFDGTLVEMFLRFAAWSDGVSCVLTGGTNLDHRRENAAAVEQGPLPEAVVSAIREIWRRCDDGTWIGLG